MATFIEYSKEDKELRSFKPKLTSIGYLNLQPEQSLRELISNFYVVNYLGTDIPSKSKSTNYNDGLKISLVPNGIGLVGTIEMIEQNELFMESKHSPFTNKQFKEIFEEMKLRIKPIYPIEPLHHQEAEIYSLIFEVLGFPMSSEEIKKFTTHEDYYKHILSGGIILPEREIHIDGPGPSPLPHPFYVEPDM